MVEEAAPAVQDGGPLPGTDAKTDLSRNAKQQLVRMVPIFSHLPDTAVGDLVDSVAMVTIAAGEILFRRGEPGDSLYILVGGRMVIKYKDAVVGDLMPGDFLGDMAVLDGQPRSATAIAAADSALLHMPGSVLFGIMESNIDVTRAIVSVLCGRVRSMMRRPEVVRA